MKLPGWRKLGGSVWQHRSGCRVHALGVAQLSNGAVISGTQWPESLLLKRFIRINGGVRRRGAMAWAIHHQQFIDPELAARLKGE